ncbi:MAG: RNA polymerase sigma factor [Candidatus Promineifilaceae bacterium]
MTDIDQLVARWQTGEQAAAEHLYNHVRGRTFRLSMGLLGNVEDAEEVTQDALTYALLNIGRFDANRAQFTTWLHTITVSRCRDKRRRKRFLLESITEWLQSGRDIVDTDLLPEQALDQLMSQAQIWQAVETLSPTLREAIVLRYWAQHSFKEMAEILSCPIGTAQSRVRLGYKKLRAVLSETNY